MQTLEAIIEKDGGVRLLSKIILPKRRRALITILDEEPRESGNPAVREPVKQPIDDAEVLGLWADREESAVDIAKAIRNANRRTT